MTIGASVIVTLTILLVGLFLTHYDLKEVESRVESQSRAQTELIGILSIDSLITQDRPALQTLVDGLQSMDSGLCSIRILNQDGIVLASWKDPKSAMRTVKSHQPVEYVGQSFGSIDTSWCYYSFAGPLIAAKVRSMVIMLVVLLLLIAGLAVLLQYYLIHPLHYLEERISSVGDSSKDAGPPRTFVSRELRSINETLDNASTVLAEKAQAEAETLTERARAEDAEAAAQAKMDFLSHMSHEIRTPLGAMMGFGQLLQAADLKEEERGFLKNMNLSGSLLLHVINDILDLSKIEAEGMEYEARSMDPERLVAEVVGMTSSLAIAKEVRLRSAAVGLDGRRVLGDEHRIKQVLLNLVGNAIKFTDEGEVSLRVEVAALLPSREIVGPDVARLRFEVADTGIGMTDEQCRQIFAPFSQADSTVTRRYGGTGLGLSVSARMVKGMGGELSVTSEPDKGSVFSFELSLPIEKAEIEQLEEKPSATLTVKSDGGGEGLKILVAEDELMLRTLFQTMFSNLGHQIELVEDGKACMERLKQGIDFDVLFVDLQMPFVGGWEIIRSLRGGEFGKKGKELKLAIMSGDVFAEDEETNARVDAFILKPIDLPVLQGFLKEICDEKREAAEVVARPATSGGIARQLRVLVVEDQEMNRCLMEELLSRQGVETFLAKDGVECLEFLETQPDLDAILMDWRMPGMDGVTAARKIREGAVLGFGQIPIALVSAEVLDRPDLEALDIVDFIPKPLDLAKLASFLEKVRENKAVVALNR